jgi:hypothetical protein
MLIVNIKNYEIEDNAMANNYKAVHTGGGGNCVFFSTAKQLSPEIHNNIRVELSKMYENPATRQQVKDTAKELIQNQFKAGFANTALNWELHGYNFKGADAADKIVDKFTKDKGELNDALALRMLMQLKCSDPEKGENRNYLGTLDGNTADIYATIGPGFAKDTLKVLSEVSPKGTKLPALLAITSVPGMRNGYTTQLFQMKNSELKSDRFENSNWNHPTKGDLEWLYKNNDVDKNNIIGLRGSNKHCKAFINTDVKAKDLDGSCLSIVKGESRNTLRGIKGFFVNMAESVKAKISNMFSGERRVSEEPSVNTKPGTNNKKNDTKGKETSKSNEFDLMDDFDFDAIKEGKAKNSTKDDFEIIDDFETEKEIPTEQPEKLNDDVKWSELPIEEEINSALNNITPAQVIEKIDVSSDFAEKPIQQTPAPKLDGQEPSIQISAPGKTF